MSTPPPPPPDACPFVSRGGLKLRYALDEFRLDPSGLVCADLGCSTGGFTDCLLSRGVARVFAVDTAYGELAWKLRKDPRVHVMERSNALHMEPAEPVDLVTLDLSWTPLRLAVPAALRWLRPEGRIIALLKPHYEHKDRGGSLPRGGVLHESVAEEVTHAVAASLPALGVAVLGLARSPILGGKGKKAGNAEWLVLLRRAET
ncbi:MAG: SAM-dependent methyltransferase [Phycisphaerales bacterium]